MTRAQGRGRRRRRRSGRALEQTARRGSTAERRREARRGAMRLEETIRVGEARAAELRGMAAAQTREELLRLRRGAGARRRGAVARAHGATTSGAGSWRRPRASSRAMRGALDGARRARRRGWRSSGTICTRRAAAPRGGDRPSATGSSCATQLHDHHLRPLVGDERGARAPRSCATSSSAWARST